jgi:NAD(P)-dependent dehydrogenase (short-subunit alcohol dehydrogenase family)
MIDESNAANATRHRRTCLITGANSGIGKAASVQIARQGDRVVMACRNRERGEAALRDVRRESGSDAVDLLIVDLSLKSSIRQAAKEYLAGGDTLDVLIHNAASFDVSQKQAISTAEGVETIWATNHLGPVLLTELLLDALRKSTQGRILTVSSKGLAFFPRLRVNLEDPEFQRRRFTVTKAYYQSKLAQVIYTFWLAEQLKEARITVNGIRVTNVKIDLGRYPNVSSLARVAYSFKSLFAISPDEMARAYAWLATSDDLAGVTGGYFDERRRQVRAPRSCYDPEHVAQVMELTARCLQGGEATG